MERLSDLTQHLAAQNKATGFFQYCWILGKYAGKGLNGALVEAERMSGVGVGRVVKAAVAGGTTTDVGWASELVGYRGLVGEWLSSFSKTTLLGQLATVRVPFFTSSIIETTPVNAAWVAEGEGIPLSKASLALTTQLKMKRIGALVVFTNELFEAWSPATQANMEDSIGKSARYALDRSLLDFDRGATDAQP